MIVVFLRVTNEQFFVSVSNCELRNALNGSLKSLVNYITRFR